MYTDDLRRATLNLDVRITWWLHRALDSGWFRIEPGAYERDGADGAVCPIVAAATMAGIWRDGQLLPGNAVWGTSECPSSEVEDFAAYFDLCAGDSGTQHAVATVRQALVLASDRRKLAA